MTCRKSEVFSPVTVDEAPPVQAKSFWKCVFSRLFMFQLLWLSVMQLRHYLFIGTLNPTLQRLAKEDPSLGKHTHTHTHTYARRTHAHTHARMHARTHKHTHQIPLSYHITY